MRRVLVIGIPGAGKSTFARALARQTDLPLIHLDKEFWQPGWNVTLRAEWRAKVADFVMRDAWIMDGNYSSSLDLRLPRADSVFWFDYPTLVCVWRVVRRVYAGYGTARPDLAEGCPERLDLPFLRYVWTFNSRGRTRIMAALDGYGRHVAPVIFRHDAQARRFLDTLSV